jgi:GR25 family glycosyltransferase involved in LPS biosynthesis
MTSEIAVLVIAYRRVENIRKILEISAHNKVSKIFVALDGAKRGSSSGLSDNLKIRKVVEDFDKIYFGEIKKFYHDSNFGCAASVLSACDWAFSLTENLIILEDDCIPTNDFFKFSKLTLDVMKKNPKIWLSCGTQFAPKNLTDYSWVLSRYALTWGWCTNRTNWNQISLAIKENVKIKVNYPDSISIEESIYWNEGSRRAHEGWTDVWDTILVKQMVSKSKLAILPNISLVTNIGNDNFATNTIGNSSWLNLQTGYFPDNPGTLLVSKVHEYWLRKEFYKISLRHICSTKFTKLRDFVYRKKIPHYPLIQRWEQSNIKY